MFASVLASGSRGNSVFVESSDTAILLDCGLAIRTLRERLAAIEREPCQIQAIFLTHDHGDHVGASVALARRFRIPLFATRGTHSVLRRVPDGLPRTIEADQPVRFGPLEVLPIATPHDGAESVAFRVLDEAAGRMLGLVTDLGFVPRRIIARLAGVNTLVAEHNHDEQMLRDGPYPWPVKQRILSGHGHLSNQQGAALVSALSHSALSRVVLAHLSETNNTPALAQAAYEKENGRRRDRELLLADQWAATPLFEV